jgi:hypothetical protein
MTKELVKKRRYEKLSAILEQADIKGSQPWLTEDQIHKLKSTAEILLAVIKVVGIAGITVTAPNLLGALDKIFYKNKHYSREEKIKKVAKTFSYLRKHGYIKFKDEQKSKVVQITNKGRERLSKIFCNNAKVPKPKIWDGKWWLVAADVPVKEYREAARMFRMKLKNMGLLNLQKSLWFYPFDPRKEIEFISSHFGISRYVTVMEINRLDAEDEKTLKTYFNKISIL